MDFTQTTYKTLLETLKKKQYKFAAFQEHLHSINSKRSGISDSLGQPFNHSVLFLRHDVDRIPQNALEMARLEHSLGIKGSYYFRVVPESYNLEIMEQIAKFGHEIGYHYEDVDLVIKRQKIKVKSKKDREELIDLAYESFCKNLEMFRKNFDIKTICMHGSPRSKFDNKLIWEKYNYKDLGLIGEPYFDTDFNEFAYLTDTGRRWNGNKFSVRDKVNSKYQFNFKTTQDIIYNIDKLPNKVMFTIHPERWTNQLIPWSKQLVMQNAKNVVKRMLINVKR